MPSKILVTLDMSKVDKTKVVSRTYTNRHGEEITAKEYKIEVIPLKEVLSLKKGSGWELLKTHFAIEALSEEEIDAGKKSTSLGDGLMFKHDEDEEDEDDDWFGGKKE